MSGSRSDARRPAGGAGGCAIHLVRFAAYSEGGCPVAGGGGLAATMADLLVALGPGGCGREVATPGFGHEQVALPVEDVIVTSNHTLFDQDGYLTRSGSRPPRSPRESRPPDHQEFPSETDPSVRIG